MNADTGMDSMESAGKTYARHIENSVVIPSPVEQVFSYLDDLQNLSSHMSESSWMMGGGKMTMEVDAGGGKTVGSKIRLTGHVFGFLLMLEEVVTLRLPPSYKAWETIGSPRLLVIGHYRMGFEITPVPNGSVLQAYINFDLPEQWPDRLLGYLFANFYAKWCIHQIAVGAKRHFHMAT